MGVFAASLPAASRIWRAASSCACTACITSRLRASATWTCAASTRDRARTVTSSSTGHDSESPVSQFGVSGRMPSAGLGGSVPDVNPLPRTHNDAKRSSRGRKHAVELAYLPRLDLFAALWVRGSGLTSGTLPPSPAEGIRPDTPNWLTGLSLSWPVLELVTVRARSRVEAAQVQVADARKREVMQAVQAQLDAARQILDAAGKEAANTPIALEAARATESQAISRYRSGLAGVVEVADAQRLLAQAEIEDAVARLNVRRGELLFARAIGDLGPFLDGVRGSR